METSQMESPQMKTSQMETSHSDVSEYELEIMELKKELDLIMQSNDSVKEIEDVILVSKYGSEGIASRKRKINVEEPTISVTNALNGTPDITSNRSIYKGTPDPVGNSNTKTNHADEINPKVDCVSQDISSTYPSNIESNRSFDIPDSGVATTSQSKLNLHTDNDNFEEEKHVDLELHSPTPVIENRLPSNLSPHTFLESIPPTPSHGLCSESSGNILNNESVDISSINAIGGKLPTDHASFSDNGTPSPSISSVADSVRHARNSPSTHAVQSLDILDAEFVHHDHSPLVVNGRTMNNSASFQITHGLESTIVSNVDPINDTEKDPIPESKQKDESEEIDEAEILNFNSNEQLVMEHEYESHFTEWEIKDLRNNMERDEIYKRQRQVDTFMSQLKSLSRENHLQSRHIRKKLKQKQNHQNSQIASQKNELEILRTEYDNLKRQLSSIQDENESLSKQNEDLLSQVLQQSNNVRKLNELQFSNLQLKEKNTALEFRVQKLEDELKYLRGKLSNQ